MGALEVFIRSCPKSVLRAEIARVVLQRWHMFGEAVHLHWLSEDVMPLNPHVTQSIIAWPGTGSFHWDMRLHAERCSTADYLFGDDDILPIRHDFITQFIEDWAKCPADVAMLGTASTIWSERHPWMDSGMDNGEMRECGVGGLVMVRKGVIPWGEFSGPANQDDSEIAAWLAAHGYRTMVSPRLLRTHVGFGLSEVSPGWWLQC